MAGAILFFYLYKYGSYMLAGCSKYVANRVIFFENYVVFESYVSF